jgi:hypothetical protein
MNDIKHKKRRGKRRKRNFLKKNGNKGVTVHVKDTVVTTVAMEN